MKRILLLTPLFLSTFQILLAQVDVLTQHNDNSRTGWNNKETILTTANVNINSFGLYMSRPLDDKSYTQPLIVTGVNTSNGSRNVVYVASVNNTVYAYDADDSSVHAPYWSVNLTPGGMIPPNFTYMHPGLCAGQYSDMLGNFGIVGTPVIDKSSGTIYLVSRYIDPTKVDNPPFGGSIDEFSYSQRGWFTYLYAMDIRNGNIKGKVLIDSGSVTYPGTGEGNINGVHHFDSRRQFNRGGLVLSGGVVYIPFAAHCDWRPCHGWIIGYDATTLQLKVVYNATPNDGRGGIWMSGTAPAVDASGNIFFGTGNAFTTNPAVDSNRGLSVVKITPNPSQNKVTVTSFYTPSSFDQFDQADWDFDIGVMLIPNSTWAFTGLKSGDLLFMDQNNLGGFHANSDNVLSVTSLGPNASMHSNFSYFRSATKEYLYLASERANIKEFPVNRTTPPIPHLDPSIDNAVNTPPGYAGGYSSTSSNDTLVSTAIMWLTQADAGCNANNALCPGILRAFQATNITNELWNSDQSPVDILGLHAKMNPPTIANGKVYVGTFSNMLQVFANRASSCINGPNIALNKPAFASSVESSSYPPQNAFDGASSTRWSSQFSDPQWIYVDLGAVYDVCGVTISWENSFATVFNLDISNDASNWTTMKSVNNGTGGNAVYTVTGTGRYVRMYGLQRNDGYGYSIWEMGVTGALHNSCTSPTLSAPTNLTTNSVTLNWQAVPGATSYNVQYKATTVQYWTTVSTASLSTTLSALTCSQDYAYQVQAVCPSGSSSFSASGFTTSNCAAGCGGLWTRYSHADIGAVGIAGTSCLNSLSGVFTGQGSGSAIGNGGADAFQYTWINAIVASDYYVARITSQDATNANNMAGLMMRDSITPWSRFAYIARTSGNGFVFMYRPVPGGATVTSNPVAGGPLPYWVKINKSGTTYSGWISSNGLTWTQVGSNIALNFGSSNAINTGIAITATNNSALSTAVLDGYSNGVALPVKFGSFTAVDINDEYIDIRWTTLVEQLNDHFDVERSGDGIHFEKIGTVLGAGTTDIPQNYSMQDYHPLQGINYYRLKQVDLNNVYTYSPVIHVRFGKAAGPLLYPNPAHSFFTIESGKDLVKEITVLNVAGSELVHMINATGWNTVNVTTDKLPEGVYLVRIKTDAQIYQQKIIIQ